MPDKLPDFILFVTQERLTDGSHVYNVIFGEHKFAAVGADEAEALANAIAASINEYSVNTADVIIEF